jgi:plasmid stabilization system protein ParE
MGGFTIKWQQEAIEDMAKIYEVLLSSSGAVIADKVDDKILNAIDLISLNPEMGKAKQGDSKPVRMYCTSTNHLIYYVPSFTNSEIVLLRILHSKQKH